jgi:hypothetical protein
MCLTKRSEFMRYFEQSYFTKSLQHNVDLVCCATAHIFVVWRVYTYAKFIKSLVKVLVLPPSMCLLVSSFFKYLLGLLLCLTSTNRLQSTIVYLTFLPHFFIFFNLNFFGSWSFALIRCGFACLLSSSHFRCLCWLLKCGFTLEF